MIRGKNNRVQSPLKSAESCRSSSQKLTESYPEVDGATDRSGVYKTPMVRMFP